MRSLVTNFLSCSRAIFAAVNLVPRLFRDCACAVDVCVTCLGFSTMTISIRKGVVITITSALQECKLPAYVHMRSAKSSRDVCSKISTCVAFGALYVCSSFLAGEFSSRCTVYDSYRALLVCVWDGVFVKRRDSHEGHWNSVRIVYIASVH